jgi:glutathione synthase/RimK-type ligase-like ATP-grasp enzyme
MQYVKLFEEFIYEENFKSKYAKKVAWIMQSHDIHSTSGNVNAREKKYNIAAKGNLFLNFATKEEFDKEDVIVPNNVPILYYGGSKDEESATFIKNKKIVVDNLYNKRDLLMISGDKTQFAEKANKFNWLPKTVFSKKEAIDGAVGFPVIAKIKNGHSGKGIQKFDTAKELEESKETFDLFCQFIDFDREYRVMFCRDKIIVINERVPTIEDNRSIRTKKADEKISFTYVYQDQNKVDKSFIEQVLSICKDVKTFLDLDLWALDVVVDQKGKLWVMETSSATGLGSVKMCEVYKAIYEDFYKEPLPDEFLQELYLNYVVPGHQNYYPKYKKEIQSSQWPMDYEILTNPKAKDGYRYFFNLDVKK